ncbi:DUF4900 domain-containing protein [bacterium]|nr:DUF4900 domain-containing protein [bacterium]
MKKTTLIRDRRGTILINTVFIVIFLVAVGFAFMNWAADEAYQAEYDLARTQAYYVAQHGILHEILPRLRKYKPGTLPEAYVGLPGGEISFDDEEVGYYSDALLERLQDRGSSDFFAQLFYFDLSATGNVEINSPFPQHSSKIVSRRVTMRAKLRFFSNYMYLTDQERTEVNTIIWFWQEDTLWGRVHSNAGIGIKNTPVFYGLVSTSQSDFIHGLGYDPWFATTPQFNVPEVNFPFIAENLRANAGQAYLDNGHGTWQTRLEAEEGGWHFQQWPIGIPFDPANVISSGYIPYGNELGIFVEGDLEILGDNVQGTCTVGSEGNMYLIDDIIYDGHNGTDSVPLDFPHLLGLISESNILIADNQANGHNNGDIFGTHSRAHIRITASLIALNQSFTFENQNRPNDPYCVCIPCPDGNGGPDERGAIYLRGSVAQRRRGFVHRSHCDGTGYDKQYEYDLRLDIRPPPHVLEAVDEKGNLMFDVVWIQDQDPQATD